MTRPIQIALLAFAIGTVGGDAHAQQPPAVRPLGPIVARAADSLASVNGIRPLSDGRVLVNDPARHRILLFDSTLQHAIIVMDSTSNTRRAYGRGYGGLLPYAGDSSLFVDRVAEAFVVLDPNGKVVRVTAVPNASDVGQLSGPLQWGTAGFDARGHLIYGTFRSFARPVIRRVATQRPWFVRTSWRARSTRWGSSAWICPEHQW